MRLFSEKVETALAVCRCHEVVPVVGVSGSGPTLAKATADALVQAAEKVLGPDGGAKQRLLGASDKTIIKGMKVVSTGEDESGLFTVKVNVLVVKELASPVRSEFDSESGVGAFGDADGGMSTAPGNRSLPPQRPPLAKDPFNSDDPFSDDPFNN